MTERAKYLFEEYLCAQKKARYYEQKRDDIEKQLAIELSGFIEGQVIKWNWGERFRKTYVGKIKTLSFGSGGETWNADIFLINKDGRILTKTRRVVFDSCPEPDNLTNPRDATGEFPFHDDDDEPSL